MSRKLPEYTSLRQMCKEILSGCSFHTDVLENTDVQQNTQYIYLYGQICSEIPSPHIFQIDVQGSTLSTHLQDSCAGSHSSLRQVCRETPREPRCAGKTRSTRL